MTGPDGRPGGDDGPGRTGDGSPGGDAGATDRTWAATTDWPTLDVLAHRARATPDRTALVEVGPPPAGAGDGPGADDPGTGNTDGPAGGPAAEWTFRELHAEVGATAAGIERRLADAGDADPAPPGTRTGEGTGEPGPVDPEELPAAAPAVGRRFPPPVATLLDTGVDLVRAAFAATRLGRPLVPLSTRSPPAKLAPRVARVGAGLLMYGREHAADARAVGAATGTPTVPAPGVAPGEWPAGAPGGAGVGGDHGAGRRGTDAGDSAATDPGDLAAGAGDSAVEAVDLAPVGRSTVALVMFTSGTTGDPKAVPLTVGNLVAGAVASAFRLGVVPGDRWLVVLPAYHMGGFAPVFRSVLYGTTAVLAGPPFDADRTAALTRRSVTALSLVPTTLRRLLDAGWTPPGSLRFVLLGGAPAPPELVERALDRGVPVRPTYGATETASQVATAAAADARERPDSVGQPLAFTEVTVVDGDGDPLPPGRTGELVVRGPTVTPGYLDPERFRAAVGPHGLHTGDVGRRDRDGRLWVLGRLDDRILTGGEAVDPRTVADALRAHPSVAEAAVVGLPDEEFGQLVGALVVPVGDGDGDATGDGDDSADGESGDDPGDDADGRPSVPTPADLEPFLRDRLAGFEIPRTWGVADALPRTASGTVDREAVRARLLGDPPGD